MFTFHFLREGHVEKLKRFYSNFPRMCISKSAYMVGATGRKRKNGLWEKKKNKTKRCPPDKGVFPRK